MERDLAFHKPVDRGVQGAPRARHDEFLRVRDSHGEYCCGTPCRATCGSGLRAAAEIARKKE